MAPAPAQAAPVVRKDQKVTSGTYGWTSASQTKLHVRPSALTPYVAQVARQTRVFVWGKFDGWYRVETSDHVFGWVYNKYLSVPDSGKVALLSHAKTQQACERSHNRTMYGTPDVLRQYYAKYKAPGALRGLKLQHAALNGSSRNGTAQSGSSQVLYFDRSKNSSALPSSSLSLGHLPAISAEDIMKARESYLESLRRSTPSDQAPVAVTPTAFENTNEDAPRLETLVLLKKVPALARSMDEDAPMEGALAPEGVTDEARFQESLPPAERAQIQTIISFKKTPAQASPSRGGSPRDRARYNAQMGKSMANQALSYRGMPYIRGASSPSRGFDCSGLVYYLLRERGFHPPRTAAALAHYGTRIPKSELRPGDMVFFANTYKRGVSHIGVYIGNNKFVHAANSRSGVKVSSLDEPYYKKKWHSARRPPAK
jgi:cell wall-associated NlpC family hydrolase